MTEASFIGLLYSWGMITAWVLTAIINAEKLDTMNILRWLLAGAFWPLIVPGVAWCVITGKTNQS